MSSLRSCAQIANIF